MLYIFAVIVLAHDWYPHECCKDGTCRPIPCSELREHPTKPYLMRGDDWIEKSEVRASPDGQCHTCDVSEAGRMYCVWVPKGMS